MSLGHTQLIVEFDATPTTMRLCTCDITLSASCAVGTPVQAPGWPQDATQDQRSSEHLENLRCLTVMLQATKQMPCAASLYMQLM